MKVIIAEKPSVAQAIASVVGARQRKEGYLCLLYTSDAADEL